MKKSAFVVAVFALTIGAFSSMGLSHAASPCGTTSRNAQDPFGSCEKSNGQIHCGGGTAVPMVGTVSTASSGTGVEGCADSTSSLPINGRLGAYADSKNNVTVFADGDDNHNPSQAGAGFTRVDVRPGNTSTPVCVRQGSGGTYWTTDGGTSNPDQFDGTSCKTSHN